MDSAKNNLLSSAEQAEIVQDLEESELKDDELEEISAGFCRRPYKPFPGIPWKPLPCRPQRPWHRWF